MEKYYFTQIKYRPLLKNSIPLSDKTSNIENIIDSMFINNPDESEDNIDVCTAHHGGLS